ncbi:uncharacterized protein F4822DRAFT_402985 [Hypoxylon trugodes]|uniref:uncharacterized protein n=1 Tax=Hypoxylon trugodes TaxID=326681 RepID=UPI00219ECB32|nr:uncharacterized protein F4822DRAFT_402985 [Hypoxylon trugodes]KAI1388493.1 hypothetical protein F4822DRAFT_402985 [Hypoxylon trugodes]
MAGFTRLIVRTLKISSICLIFVDSLVNSIARPIAICEHFIDNIALSKKLDVLNILIFIACLILYFRISSPARGRGRTLPEQQRIITCVKYRHVFGQLPDRGSGMHNAPLSSDGYSAAWKKTLRIATECVIQTMIVHYIDPSPITPSATSSLQPLLQYDFEMWVKQSGSLRAAKKHMARYRPELGESTRATKNEWTAEQRIEDILAILQSKTSRQARANKPTETKTTGNFSLAEYFKPNYSEWPSFQRGYGLYHELSGNIHAYCKFHDVQEDIFWKSDGHYFDWLTPKDDEINHDTGKVDWPPIPEKQRS